MGLFMNSEQHHGMYRNLGKINEPNQTTFRRDHLVELLKEQQKMNNSLQKSMLKLGILNEQRDQKQLDAWQEVSNHLSRVEKAKHQQESQIMEQLITLTDENKKLQMMMENERIFDIEIVNQMKQHSLNNEKLSQQIIEQKDSQQEVLTRLDSQEALTEKALRQIGNLRSSLFERTNYLAET